MSTGLIIILVAAALGIVLFVVGIVIGFKVDEYWVIECGGIVALLVTGIGIFIALAHVDHENDKKLKEALESTSESITTEDSTGSIIEDSCSCEDCDKSYTVDYKFCPKCGAELRENIAQ